MSDVSDLLKAVERGDPHATSELLPLVYEELRRLAAQKLAGEEPGQTLQPTALVHEAYLRLVGDGDEQSWNGRGHFFAAAAEAMRRILVENARRKKRHKHGGGRVRQELDPEAVAVPEASDQLLALDEALTRLAKVDPQAGQLVQLRYFGGLTLKEAAEVLGVSSRTADSYWAYARSWLLTELRSDGEA
jgi:RNA polymerase sigma factor (TIGR02999 family)